MTTELAVATPIKQESPQAMMMAAIDKGVDLDKLEKFLILQERYDQNQARKAYHVAMAAFKTEDIKVIKDKINAQYKSKYSSEDSLLNTVNPFLSKHDLSAAFSFSQKDGFMVTCTITHAMGHSESVSLTGPVDTSGSKNALQQIKSTATYLRKATFEAITGIASSDSEGDDDGNGASAYISDKEHHTIMDMILAKSVNEAKFLEFMGADSIEHIKACDFQKAMAALRTKK
jgi:hypothetical protein